MTTIPDSSKRIEQTVLHLFLSSVRGTKMQSILSTETVSYQVHITDKFNGEGVRLIISHIMSVEGLAWQNNFHEN